MNSPEENGLPGPVSEAEKTLRLIASLPAPDGLADRVQAGLRAAPRSRILLWPTTLMPGAWLTSPALRGVAAAAIVCVVAGGGWRIYSRVQVPVPTANVITMPARVGAQGAFSNAGAMRTPDTLAGPVLTHSVTPPAAKPPAKPHARRHKPHHASPIQPR
jgi:hypothetical protein